MLITVEPMTILVFCNPLNVNHADLQQLATRSSSAGHRFITCSKYIEICNLKKKQSKNKIHDKIKSLTFV